MNSYNENLHSTVSTSLLNLELDEKNVKSQLDASMFTLYYSQGARITAAEKLDWANNRYKFQQDVNDQAVNNNNISVNLLYSANQQKSYTAQSVTNAAVCAANVQVAANAVLRLASDMGSIYSMLSAADFGSEIYLQSRTAYTIMSDTAYDAEKASQSAMDASTATAEVSASTVADEANATNTSIGNLFAITGADFSAISAIVATNNADLSTASATEKVAEGSLEMVNVEYFATQSAYVLNNKELNLDLTVTALNFDYIDVAERENDTYKVTFSYYKSPFSAQQVELLNHDNKGAKKVVIPPGYPVKEYHIILVKDSKKTIFSMATAESVLLYKDRSHTVSSVPMPGQTYAEAKIHRLDMKDSDGEKMDLGKKYVVFVLAILTDDYKKSINIFDDYLTAPSAYFKLTTHLASPAADTIKVNAAGTQVKFTLKTNDLISEYRCMFLPDNTAQINGLLSASGLRSIEQEAEKLEKVAREFDPKITESEAKLADLVVTHEGLLAKHDELSSKEPVDDAEKESIDAEIATIRPRLLTLPDEITEAQKTVKHHHHAKEMAMRSLAPVANVKPGFFFNRKLAEQVSHANYWIADVKTGFGTVPIDETTTDNFGNLLIKDKSYIPVILTVANVSEDNLEKYTSSLSDFENTASFPEKIIKK